jgi:single-stranded DNA-binding protein
MLNQIILVGRIEKMKKVGDGAIITLRVPRSFKNEDGEYKNDYIDVSISGDIAKTTLEYCKKDDIVGAKGRVQSKEIEKYHTKTTIIEIIGEKITFLSSKS